MTIVPPSGRGLDLQAAAQRLASLAHAVEPEALAGRGSIEAATVVGDDDADRVSIVVDGDGDPGSGAVLGGVRQRLLDDPVDRGLEIGIGHALRPEPDGDVDLEVDPARAVGERAQRRLEPQLVERGRTQVVDERAQPGHLGVDPLERLVDRRRHRLAPSRTSPDGQPHVQGREALQRLVVELARPAPALLLGRGEPLAPPLRLGRLGGRERDRGARGERLQEPLVVVAEARAVLEPVDRDEDPVGPSAEGDRHDEPGLGGEPEPPDAVALEAGRFGASSSRYGVGRLGLSAEAGLVVPMIFRGRATVCCWRSIGSRTARLQREDQRLLEAFAASAATARRDRAVGRGGAAAPALAAAEAGARALGARAARRDAAEPRRPAHRLSAARRSGDRRGDATAIDQALEQIEPNRRACARSSPTCVRPRSTNWARGGDRGARRAHEPATSRSTSPSSWIERERRVTDASSRPPSTASSRRR